MDPRTPTAGRRSFLEGNLFTYQGNGIQLESSYGDSKAHLMVFEETMELLAFLYSGGGMADHIYRDLMGSAGHPALCKTAGIDVQGLVRVDRRCAKENFVELLIKYAGTMPELKQYLIDLNREKREELVESLMGAAFSPVYSLPDYIEKSELTVMVMIAHYSEAVMTRYNKNADGLLDTDEVWGAYPTFRGFIEKMLITRCLDHDEERIKDIYRYIISKGVFPQEGLWTGVDFFLGRFWWSASLDRGRVLQVFSSIISSVIKGGVPNAPAPVCQ
jgi:hypothetical protein